MAIRQLYIIIISFYSSIGKRIDIILAGDFNRYN
jgi:hypothetical protein